MSSDAHAVRTFFQNAVPNALRRASSLSNKFATNAMGSPSRTRRSTSPSRHAHGHAHGKSHRRSSSAARSRSRSRSTPRSSSRSTSPSPWRASESSVSVPTKPRAPSIECDGLPPASVRVSVNLRYSRRAKPLLPFDIFVAPPANASIADMFSMAADRDPDDVIWTSYRLRRDKKAIVLCGGGLEDRYAHVDDPVKSISQLNPLRIIFCVFDAPPPPPQPQGLLLNARVIGDTADFLGDDLELDTTTESCTVGNVWERFVRAEPDMARFKVRCLSASRPADGVQMKIGLMERIADVATTGASRYIFELDGGEDGSSMDSKDKEGDIPSIEIDGGHLAGNEVELDDDEFSNSTGSDYSDEEAGIRVAPGPEEEEEMTFYDEQDEHEYRYRKPKKPKSILRQPSRRN